jgi:integrase
MKLNAATAKALTLPPGVKDKTFFDDALGGFGLRLREGGSRNWIVQYDIAGKTRRVTLGSTAMLDVGAARNKARDILAGIRLGGDPAAEKRARQAQAADTFAALLPRYLTVAQREMRPRSFVEIKRRLLKLARPLHSRPLASIDRRMVSGLIGTLAEKNGPAAAINGHSALSGYFAWLVREGLLEQNPMLYANKPKKRPGRDRVLSEAELRTLWTALDGSDYGDIVRLLIYTAGRRAEIGSLRWGEVNLEEALIEIPGARMKNGKPHVVPLSGPALAILKKRERNGRDHVFGQGPSGFEGWSWRRKDLDRHMIGPRPNWVLHDLRRLASTTMHEKLGIQPHIVERVLAHVGHQSGVAGTYNKAEYLAEKRRALQRWAEWVDAVLSGRPAKAQVIQLGRKRR